MVHFHRPNVRAETINWHKPYLWQHRLNDFRHKWFPTSWIWYIHEVYLPVYVPNQNHWLTLCGTYRILSRSIWVIFCTVAQHDTSLMPYRLINSVLLSSCFHCLSVVTSGHASPPNESILSGDLGPRSWFLMKSPPKFLISVGVA